MNYSETMGRAWGITWKNKWLILLALIPALSGLTVVLMGFAGGFPTDPAAMSPEMLSGLFSRTMLLSCGSLVLGLLLGIIGLAARGGMIAGVAGVERGEMYGFGRAFRAGWRKLLSLIGMTILLYAVVVILYLVMIALILIPLFISAVGAASGENDGLLGGMGILAVLAMCCLGLLIFVVALVVSFVYPFAYRGIILRDLGAVDAIRHGWRVLRQNLGEILLLTLPFLVITVLAVGAYLGIYYAIAFPSMMEQMNNALAGISPTTMGITMLSPLFLVLYVVYALIMSVVAAWQSATFTLAYLQWTGKEGMYPAKTPADDLPLNPVI